MYGYKKLNGEFYEEGAVKNCAELKEAISKVNQRVEDYLVQLKEDWAEILEPLVDESFDGEINMSNYRQATLSYLKKAIETTNDNVSEIVSGYVDFVGISDLNEDTTLDVSALSSILNDIIEIEAKIISSQEEWKKLMESVNDDISSENVAKPNVIGSP